MKSKIKEYTTGIILTFLLYLMLISVAGVVVIFVVKPIFIYLKTGQFIFLPDVAYVKTVIKMTLACSLSVSVLVFNINWFKLVDMNDL